MRVGFGVFVVSLMATIGLTGAAPGMTGPRRDLGVSVQEVDEEIAGNMGLDSARGVLVIEVKPGSAAAGAGLRVNDIILGIDGRRISEMGDYGAVVERADTSGWVSLEVWRAENLVTAYVFLGAGRPPGPRPSAAGAGEEKRVDIAASSGEMEGAGEEVKGAKKPRKRVEVSGYIQTHFLTSDDSNGDGSVTADRFRVLRARVEVSGQINPHVGYEILIDPRSPMLSGLLRDAFIELKYIPRHKIRIGQQKTRFGYENNESSTELWYVNRSELSDSLMRGINLRDIGVGLIGDVKLGNGFRLEDAITVVNGRGLNPAGTDDNNNRKNVWGRLGVRYRNKAHGLTAWLGVSGANGDQFDEGDDEFDPADDFTAEIGRTGVDLEVDHDWFFFAGEYAKGTDDVSGEVTRSRGYYLNLVGKTPWKIGPAIRLDTLDNEWKRWTFGGYYGLPKDDLRVLVNYERRQLEDGERGDDRLYTQLQVRF